MSGDTQNNNSVTKDYLGNVANSLSNILKQLSCLLTEVRSNISTQNTARRPRKLPQSVAGARSLYDRYGIEAGPEYCQPKNAGQGRRTSAPRNWKPFVDSGPKVLLPAPPAGQCQGSETDLIAQKLNPPEAPFMPCENVIPKRRRWSTDITAQKGLSTWGPNWLTKMVSKPGSPQNQPLPPPNNIRQQQCPQMTEPNYPGVPRQQGDFAREPSPEEGMYWLPLENEGKPKPRPTRNKWLKRQNAQDKGMFWVPSNSNDNDEVKKNERSQTVREPAKRGLRRAKSMAGQSGPKLSPRQIRSAKQQAVVTQKPVVPRQQDVARPQMTKLPDVGLASRRFYDQHGIDPLKDCSFAPNARQIRRSSVPREWVPPAPAGTRPGEFAKPKVGSIERRFYAQHGIDVPLEYNAPAVPSQSRRRSAPESSFRPDRLQPVELCLCPCPSRDTYQRPKHRKWNHPQQQHQPDIPNWTANACQHTFVVSSKLQKRKPRLARAGPSEVASPAAIKSRRLPNIAQQVQTAGPSRAARAKRSPRKCGRQSAGFDISARNESAIRANTLSRGLQKTVLLPEKSSRLLLDSLETLRQKFSGRDKPSVVAVSRSKAGPHTNIQIPSLNPLKPTKLSEFRKRMHEKTRSIAKYYETADKSSGTGRRIAFSKPITRDFNVETSENPPEYDEHGFIKARPEVLNLETQEFPAEICDDYQETPVAESDATRPNLWPKLKSRVEKTEAVEATKETRSNLGIPQRGQENPVKIVDSLGSLGWDLLKNSYLPASAL